MGESCGDGEELVPVNGNRLFAGVGEAALRQRSRKQSPRASVDPQGLLCLVSYVKERLIVSS